ncbi:MAG TPA: hypothetical protein VGO43_10595 [Pyrinomonadaceae bacterium]|jgi:hypothetical protein|nr:hypothetical protein [Pyrinomonadaceae bacterium]
MNNLEIARFTSYGVGVEIRSNDSALLAEALDVAKDALLGKLRTTRSTKIDQYFELSSDDRRGIYTLDRNNGDYVAPGPSKRGLLSFFNSMVRVSVAEAAHKYVFLHAGVVGWRGKAIVLPANSFKGKSTLVKALVEMGAEYYSDDFAILDRTGAVHPFARPISLRAADSDFTPYEVTVAEIGGRIGVAPLPLGMLFLTSYAARARWNPRILSNGEGILATLPFAIAIKKRPELCLRVLKLATDRAIIASSSRGDVNGCAKKLLDFFDKHAD